MYPPVQLLYANKIIFKKKGKNRHRWLMPVILALQERSGGLQFKGSPGKWFLEALSRKTLHKNRAGRVDQDKGPKFKPQYHSK
jgi:hypothetical protein